MLPELTERQRQVAELAGDHTIEEIAEKLGISRPTAKGHCDMVRMKLGVPRKRHIPAALRAIDAFNEAE